MRLFTLLTILFFYLGNLHVSAQDTEALLKRANKMYEAQAFLPAIDLYTEVLIYDNPLEAKEKLAHSYRRVSEFEKAEYWYRLIIPVIKDRKLDFNLAQVLQGQGKYEEAAALYMSYADIYPRSAIFADACLNSEQFYVNSEKYKVDNLSINSPNSEFGPVLFRDNQLVFTSSQDGNKKPSNDYYDRNINYLDMYVTQPFVSDWSKPKPLKGSINSQYHDGPACFDKYYQNMWFTRNTTSKGKGVKEQTKKLHLQLFSAKVAENDKWADIEPFVHNSEAYTVAHPTLSENGQLLYFSSNMPGGYGNSDLYVCVKIDTTWSEPKNLGPDINTPEDEQFPYIHEDGTLYFSSNGHPGLGGFDIFFSKPVKRTWSQPQNMGAPVNSPKDDFSIVFNNRGGGYFASNRDGGKGMDDIYRFSVKGQLNYPKSIAGSQSVEEAQYAQVSNFGIIDGSNETIVNEPIETNNNSANKKEKKKQQEAKNSASKNKNEQKKTTSKPNQSKVEKEQQAILNKEKKAKEKADKAAKKAAKTKKTQKKDTNLAEQNQDGISGGQKKSTKNGQTQGTAPTNKEKRNSKKEKDAKEKQAPIPKDTNVIAQVPENSLNAELNIGPVQFKGKSAVMTEDVLDQIAPVIVYVREHPRTKIRIESFTDARGTAQSNVDLSKQRLAKIVEFFYQNGINQTNIELVARGETGILNECTEGANCSVAKNRFNQRVIFSKVDRNTKKVVTSNVVPDLEDEEFIDFEKNKKEAEKQAKKEKQKQKKDARLNNKDKNTQEKDIAVSENKKEKKSKADKEQEKKAKAAQAQEIAPTMPNLTPTNSIEGFTFAVVVGPYANFSIEQKQILNKVNLQQKLITVKASKKKIELLRLEKVEEAEQLQLYLKAQGFRKAKVIVYRNGQLTGYSVKDMKK